jgi:hypothetical protein
MSDRWWDSEENFDVIAEWSKQLLQAYPHARIISVGQSSYWITKAAELMAAHRQEKNNTFHYCAFSGRFVNWENPADDTGHRRYKVKMDKSLMAEVRAAEIAEYRAYLEERGCRPSEIVRAFKESGIPTVLVDWVDKGRTIASFISVLKRRRCQYGSPPGKPACACADPQAGACCNHRHSGRRLEYKMHNAGYQSAGCGGAGEQPGRLMLRPRNANV